MKNVLLLTLLSSMLLMFSTLNSCTPAANQISSQNKMLANIPTSVSPSKVELGAAKQGIIGEVIWSGKSDGFNIWWTTVDLYAQSAVGTMKIFAPLVQKGFEDFASTQLEEDRAGKEELVMDCEYERSFKILSIIGTLVSFEDQYGDYCGGAHPSADTRFTTIDLARPGEVLYARSKDTPMMDVNLARLGKIVNLTDYFSEKDILQALLADPIIKKALNSLHTRSLPQTLTELSELFAKNNYELGDSLFELRPDFLTRFAFHHIEDDKVAVRISFPPHYGANQTQHMQLGLLLPIPPALRQPLVLAITHQEGFLMKNARELASNQTTKFNLRVGKDARDRR